jgi:glutathione S-transferase
MAETPPGKFTLFYTPVHEFIHKVLIAAHEAGLWNRLEMVPIFPRREGYGLGAINPLAKVPTLALADGKVLYGSQTICEVFDSFNTTAPLFPKSGDARWDAVTRLCLADITFELAIKVGYEPQEAHPRADVVEWNWPKIIRALDTMEADAGRLKDFDIGQAATLHALSYLHWHVSDKELMPPVPPRFDWRVGRPKLTAWWDRVIQRPSVQSHFRKPYVGDTSAENAQRKIADVIARQKRSGLR